MLQVIVGHSNDPDSRIAIDDVLDQCSAQLTDTAPQAAILLAAMDFDHGMILRRINQAFPGIQLIGGTTDGEMSSVLQFQQDSLVLFLLASDVVEFTAAVGRNISRDPMGIAAATARAAKASAGSPAKLCLTIPESLTASGVEILAGLKAGLGLDVAIVGGSAGDQWSFRQTYQFFNTEVLSDAVPILLLCGQILFGVGLDSGWTLVGRKGIVTKAVGNKVYTVDDQPIINFYEDYLGTNVGGLTYRLAVFEPGKESWYMRSSNGIPEDGAISFFADVPEQAQVQVVQADRNSIVSAARSSICNALANYPARQPEAAVFFSCAGRRQVLGTRTKVESEAAQIIFGNGVPFCGFYTYGEIAPLQNGSEAQFHNETFVTLLLGTK